MSHLTLRLLAALVLVGALALAACPGDPTTPGTLEDAADVADTTSPDVADTAASEVSDTVAAEDVADDTLVNDTSGADTLAPDTLTPDTAEPDASPDTIGSPPCDPPLAVSPSEAWTPERSLVTLVASGGTGAYRYTLVTEGSGALLNATNGAYLSGSVVGVTDEIRVTDLGCEGEALAHVTVTPALTIAPAAATVPPTTGTVAFAASGGSGERSYTLLVDATGASVTADGHYTAGDTEGTDRVRVTDPETGEVSDADVTVVVGARLRLEPERLFVPVGERYALDVRGGSGVAEVAVAGDAVAYSEGWLMALRAGEAAVTLSDPYTGLVAQTTVTAVASPVVPSVAAGDSNWTSYVVVPGDLNGDGFADAVVTVNEADIDAWDSGALFVYAGTAEGLAPTPARILSGAERQDHLGRGLAVVDIDGDGLLDLVVGAHDSDLGGNNSGAVLVYPGREGAFFADAPSKTLVGLFGGDGHGHSLAVCDFNGDGALDLAVGVRFGEDRSQSPVVSNTGAVRLYLGGPSGWLPTPDMAVYGQLPDGQGGWAAEANMQLGWQVAAGDVDGDGLCDLVAAGVQYASASGRGQDGAVAIYRGRGPDALSPGGVEMLPAVVMVGDEPDAPQSRLGWALAVGDLTGDGAAEVVIGQPYYRRDGANQNGAVRILRGGPLPEGGASETIGPDAVEWSWYGGDAGNGSDFFGWSVAIGDADGVAPDDLLVGTLQDEVAGGPTNTGTVLVLAGREGELPDVVPSRVSAGDTNGQRYGVAAAPYPDVDGDGVPELVVRAAFDSAEGPRAGRTYLAPSAVGAGLVPLESPVEPAGAEIGVALALLPDLNGDGLPELAVGAPRAQADPESNQIRPGIVSVHAGRAGGFEDGPLAALGGYPGHSTSDRFGDDLAVIDDFDGDGAAELAVVASSDDTGNACAPSRNDPGAVRLFALGAGGVLPTPVATFYGSQAGQRVHHVTGADLDGDGVTELVATSRLLDGPDASGAGRNVGGVWIVRRPAADSDQPEVICEADRTLLGGVRDGQLGTAVAALGDVDGDGCDDLAVGAGLDDAPANASGSVYLLLGWGAGCASATPRAVRMSALVANSQVGSSLAAGRDVDDDGVPDLVVGGPQFRDGGNPVGAVWLVPGTWLGAVAAEAVPWVDGEAPPIVPLSPPDNDRTLRLEGRLAGEQLGAAVALVPAPGGGGFGAVAVGRPLSDLPGVTGAGAVSLFVIGPEGLRPAPIAGLGGETRRPRSELGISLLSGLVGGVPVVVAGARRASAYGLDDGAVYPLVLTAGE